MINLFKTIYSWIIFQRYFFRFRKRFVGFRNSCEVIFIFPFYHTGGAERVHLDIVKSVADKKTCVVFTGNSYNEHFKPYFEKYSNIIEVRNVNFSKHFEKKIESYILKSLRTYGGTIFGCHSILFYKLSAINFFAKKVDLIHAFTRPEEAGFEKTSLPYIDYLSERVTINQRTKADILKQYNQEGVEPNHKIKVIYNCVKNGPDKYPIKPDEVKVLFVGRGSVEKRVQVVGKIASILKEEQISVNLVGSELKKFVYNEDKQVCNFKGGVNTWEELSRLYSESHFIIITSYREGIPMVLQEAMKFGVIPISTDVGGISEIEGIYLIDLIENEDEQARLFSNQIIALCSDVNSLKSKGKQIFDLAKGKFLIEEFNEQYRRVLLKE